MKYNLYICKTNYYRKNEYALRAISRIRIKTTSNYWHNPLLAFDILKIKKNIGKIINKSCKITIENFFHKTGEIAYLHIVVPYKIINEVLPKLLAITEENKLVLYDSEVEKIYYKEIDNESFVQLKIREKQIKTKILKEIAPIYKIRQLLSCHYFYNHIISEFVVTLNEKRGISFEERILEFNNCLKNILNSNEELDFDDKCFKICSNYYFIRFCVEGYGANSKKLGYMQNSKVCAENLDRMSVEEGFLWISKAKYTKSKWILNAMNYKDLLIRYDNPAVRFIKIIKFSERLNEQPFNISVGSLNYRNFELVITPKEIDTFSETTTSKYYSSFRLDLVSLDLLGPFFREYYPYFDARYYCFTNPIVPQAWHEIVNRVKEIKIIIENDIDNPMVKDYADKFGCHSFHFNNAPKDEWLEPLDLIKKYKKEICEMLSIFIEWSESQLDSIDKYGDCVFNLVGP